MGGCECMCLYALSSMPRSGHTKVKDPTNRELRGEESLYPIPIYVYYVAPGLVYKGLLRNLFYRVITNLTRDR